ncbi:hypothetical protein [Salinarimonas soli]|uniref:Uncharacterized protein n=1 Tax=Salinarimonas soli TaxID=1638099 RepID=A0A5B2V8D0_9HYPH|nr:hypothetical protein [Salinarimonas soli]KAA2235304.1 hypothetical protein F0L46_20010 [Salinarimonas soli]
MRSDATDPSRPSVAPGWAPVGGEGVTRGWPASFGVRLAGAFPPPAPPAAPVVNLAERRASEAARSAPRRVPEEDMLDLGRPVAAPANRPADDDVLDLATLPAHPAPRSAPIPFPTPGERRRRILYLGAAAIIMATGLAHTFKTAKTTRAILVPDAAVPDHRVT